MKHKIRRAIALVFLISIFGSAMAVVPAITWVPMLLNQVILYLYPKNQEVPYPDTPRMKRMLASHHGFICRSRILVTSPQTVAFYRERNKVGNYLGITSVGKWLANNHMCIDNQPIMAVTWDKNGKTSHYVSRKKHSNINQQMTLTYPQDFIAPNTKKLVSCQAKVLNLSSRPLVLYAGRIATDTRVALLKPFASLQLVAPCFKQEKIIGVQVAQSGKKIVLSYFATPRAQSDINQIPVIEFPKNFMLTSRQVLDLKPDLMKLLIAAL